MKNFTKTAVFCVSLFTVQLSANAQSKVNGVVKDNNSKPLQSVTVSLLQAKDSGLVKIDVSDKEGKFSINSAREGDFLLSYSSVGFEKKYSEVFSVTSGNNVTVKEILLDPTTGNLKGVTITNKKPLLEVKADKTVFNVEASINAQGSNALELLQKSPGIQVDNNDNISMKGKTGVKVYVDGKMMQLDTKDLAAYLKSINSNDIEAIEMISNPSAKYDASGNAGIINIRLKKNKRFGTNGSVNAGFVQGVTPKGNGSLNLNYRDKKINLFGNVGGNIGRYENTLDLYRIQKDTLYNQKTVMHSDDKSVNVKAGADYFINSNHTIGVMATTNIGNTEWTSNSKALVSYVPTGVHQYDLIAGNTVPGKRTNANFNLNYRYTDTTGREINFDADYGIFRGRGNSVQPNEYVFPNTAFSRVVNRNNTPTDIDIYTVKTDAEQKLGKGKFGYGFKVSVVNTKNTFDFFQDINDKPEFDEDRSSSFTYKENVNAAYVNYQQQLNEKWSIQAGLRGEQTNSDGKLVRANDSVGPNDRVKRHYFNLFPSAAVTWNINQKHSLNLTYSRRIDRPTYQDLNPFENKLDELTYERGNPFLRPQYTHSIELTHTLMGMINTTLGYSNVSDYATQATDTIKNATYVQQKNLAKQQIFSLNVGSPLPIKPWWNGYVNLWANNQMFDGKIGENKVHQNVFSYGAYMQHTFTLGKDYSAEISGWFNGPSVWGGTWRTSSQGAMDIGVQKQFLQKAATIKLAATDIFHTAPWKATNDFGGLYVKGGGSWESQTFRVSLSWRFGSSQVKAARDRKTGLESESRRIKGGN
ncbi:MAG: outer membrane beta-barrel family protein [Ferruginibacter sp.]